MTMKMLNNFVLLFATLFALVTQSAFAETGNEAVERNESVEENQTITEKAGSVLGGLVDSVTDFFDESDYVEADIVDEPMRPRIQTLLSGAKNYTDAKQYNDALKQLDKIGRLDLRNQERIMLHNTYAYVHYLKEDNLKAIESYKAQLALPNNEEALKKNTLFSLAQLQMGEEQTADSLATMEQWLALEEEPSPEVYLFKAQLHYQEKQYKEAAAAIDTGIGTRVEQAKKANKKVSATPESWLLLKRAVYFNANDYVSLESILKQLIMEYPKTEYWMQLSAVYNELGRGEKELAAMQVTYEAGNFKKENEVIGYSQILMANDLPYEAAQVLDKGLSDKVITDKPANYAMLSDAWLLAKEYDKSIASLKTAASNSPKGQLSTRLAQILLDREQFEEAVSAANDSIKKPNKDVSLAYLVKGMALYSLDKFNEAKSAFSKAAEHKKTAKSAKQWIKQIDDKVSRQKEIDKYLNL